MPRYRIVPERSRVWIDARSNVHPIHSTADGLEGYVDLEVEEGQVKPGDRPTGKLSFPVARLTSGNWLEDRELHRRIDAGRFPTIEGELTRMDALDDAGRYLVAGELAFRGVTRSVEDEMTVRPAGDMVELAGESRFDIRDFGMEPPRILMLRVEPEVHVRVQLVAERVPDA